jgi:hypothetical protein
VLTLDHADAFGMGESNDLDPMPRLRTTAGAPL